MFSSSTPPAQPSAGIEISLKSMQATTERAGRWLGRKIFEIADNPHVQAVAAAFLRTIPFIVAGTLLPPWVNLGIVVASYCAADNSSLAKEIVNAGAVTALLAGAADIATGTFRRDPAQVIRGVVELSSSALCFNRTGLSQHFGAVGAYCHCLGQRVSRVAERCDQIWRDFCNSCSNELEQLVQPRLAMLRRWSFEKGSQ